MTELTDLDICKKIAEIEGVNYEIRKDEDDADGYVHPVVKSHVKILSKEYWMGEEYNPLTDDALCINLAKKHKLCIDFINGFVQVTIKQKPHLEKIINGDWKRSCAIAIIEANK